MKKRIFNPLFLFAFFVCLCINQQNHILAQSYEDYYKQFPAITAKMTWDTPTMEKYPQSDKPTLDEKFYGLIGGKGNGKGKWGTENAYSGRKALYPLGKIEVGKTIIVFILSVSNSYVANDNTQMSLDAFCYEKKTGNLLRGGIQFYLAAFGGDVKYQKFMYTSTVNIDTKGITIDQKEEKTNEITKKTYRFKSVGLDMVF